MKIVGAAQRDGRKVVVAIIDADDLVLLGRLRATFTDGARHRAGLPAGPRAIVENGAASLQTLPRLTQRQAAILPLLMADLSNKEIGRQLAISHFTVRNHISQILRALGVRTRRAASAVLWDLPMESPDH